MVMTDAAVLRAVGEPLTVETLRLVDPGPHEVLVRLRASGVCHSDLHVTNGEWERPLPVVLGHEGAGIVEKTGVGVTLVRPGSHVILSWTPNCGRCRYCATGRPVLCAKPPGGASVTTRPFRLWHDDDPVHAGAGVGSFAEYCVVPEAAAITIRPDVPFDIAAIIGCAVMTGIGAVTNTVNVAPGSSVLVVGCGGVGLSALLGCGLVGASSIIAVDLSDEKLRTARDLGATHTINAATTDWRETVFELTTGTGVDLAIEAIGRAATIEGCFEVLAPGGTAVIVGQVPDGVRIQIDPMVMSDREKVLRGSNYGSARPSIDIPHIANLYAQGRLDLDALITSRIPLSGINDSLDSLRRGEGTRSVVVY